MIKININKFIYIWKNESKKKEKSFKNIKIK